jgi:hypothetical protein
MAVLDPMQLNVGMLFCDIVSNPLTLPLIYQLVLTCYKSTKMTQILS